MPEDQEHHQDMDFDFKGLIGPFDAAVLVVCAVLSLIVIVTVVQVIAPRQCGGHISQGVGK